LPPAELETYLRSFAGEAQVTIESYAGSHTFLSMNGPFAWELLALFEGPGAIGFPYLTFYRPSEDRIYFRAGKTGEFGYDLMIPKGEAEGFFATLLERGRAFDLKPIGAAALFHASLENWFFNIHREGKKPLAPIELQLQWRISRAKRHLPKGPPVRRITPIIAEVELAEGDQIEFESARIGEVLVAERSATLGVPIAIALLDIDYAWSGIDRYTARGARVKTVSAPFINNLSTFVSVHRDRYAKRHEVRFPGHERR
jgi:glycine cleavage system aminomethyltransferase T